MAVPPVAQAGPPHGPRAVLEDGQNSPGGRRRAVGAADVADRTALVEDHRHRRLPVLPELVAHPAEHLEPAAGVAGEVGRAAFDLVAQHPQAPLLAVEVGVRLVLGVDEPRPDIHVPAGVAALAPAVAGVEEQLRARGLVEIAVEHAGGLEMLQHQRPRAGVGDDLVGQVAVLDQQRCRPVADFEERALAGLAQLAEQQVDPLLRGWHPHGARDVVDQLRETDRRLARVERLLNRRGVVGFAVPCARNRRPPPSPRPLAAGGPGPPRSAAQANWLGVGSG